MDLEIDKIIESAKNELEFDADQVTFFNYCVGFYSYMIKSSKNF